jgi:hypothetical protein
MIEELIVKPLRCGHCGGELPVSGQLVTFQCPACRRYWVIAGETLEPIVVHRASPIEANGAAKENAGLLYLPFWVAEVDGAALRREVMNGTPERSAAHELDRILARLEGLSAFSIYVPGFRSLNTYAYLKVGRLLTRMQPSFALEPSEGTGHTILCGLRAEEAVALIDFVFFAILPESIQSNAGFLKDVHLTPAHPLRLVEFPFEERGASLVSVIGGFWISGKLVEGIESLVP